MSQTESGAAEQMVNFGIRALEALSRLAGSGAKNLAVFLAAWAKNNHKNRGRTTLGRMLRDGKELKVFQIDRTRLKEFAKEAKRHGVLFTAIRDKKIQGIQVDVMVRAEDASKINRIIEKMNLATRNVATVQTQPAQENPTQARTGRKIFSRSKPRPSVRFSVNNELTGVSEDKFVELKPSVRATIQQIRRMRDETRTRPLTNDISTSTHVAPSAQPQIARQPQQPVVMPQPVYSQVGRVRADEITREINSLIVQLQGILTQIEPQPVPVVQQVSVSRTVQPVQAHVDRQTGQNKQDKSANQPEPRQTASVQRRSVRENISQIKSSRGSATSATQRQPIKPPRAKPTSRGR